jgi:hypothetical protein
MIRLIGPGLPTRLMAGLAILKHTYNLSDEAVCELWLENAYYQYFCGEEFFQHRLPLDRSSMTNWRNRMGEERLRTLLQESLATATRTGAMKPSELSRVIVDTTVQPKNITFPTDAKLLPHLLARRLDFPEHGGAFGVETFRVQSPGERERRFDRFFGLTSRLLYGLNGGLTVKLCRGRFGQVSRTLPARAGPAEHQFQTRDLRAARCLLGRRRLASNDGSSRFAQAQKIGHHQLRLKVEEFGVRHAGRVADATVRRGQKLSYCIGAGGAPFDDRFEGRRRWLQHRFGRLTGAGNMTARAHEDCQVVTLLQLIGEATGLLRLRRGKR